MTSLYSFGLGVGTQNRQEEWLDVFYPAPELNPTTATTQALAQVLGYIGGNQAIALSTTRAAALADALSLAGNDRQAATARALANSNRPLVATLLETDSGPASVPEAYLKLHLLSHRLVKPHGTNLNGIFG